MCLLQHVRAALEKTALGRRLRSRCTAGPRWASHEITKSFLLSQVKICFQVVVLYHQLHSIHRFYYIGNMDKISKKIIKEGEGDERPEDGYEVTVHYTGTFEDGKEFDSSRSRGSPFNFTIGTGSVIKGWDEALKTMRRNEVAEFGIPPELAYGEKGSPPTIPPNTKLIFNIELLDFVIDNSDPSKPIFKMSLEERLAKCQEKKEAGGNSFKAGQFDSAIRQYRDVMKLAEVSEFRDDGKVVELDSMSKNSQMPAESDADKTNREQLKQMLLVSYLNLAICFLKLDNLKECIANCDHALEIDAKNVKAHFRKGLAFLSSKDYDMAMKQFDTVLQLDPNNSEAKTKKTVCINEVRAYNEKQKQVYKNLFTSKS